ncbi:imidazole glycerol phosphate synthase subunit HisF [Pseudomonas soli]|uniref:imidazole glycerol-phosphate synthase n=1 Tax=Pseudomonas soli TaxID=1306993 RepID=A0AAJ5SSB6_9PSED|nr:AglZ/HisF2 family acetamidino modification protein [Pseudomonas soli]MDW9405654.1 imidazole glycerol phosphate synthase subunit HisF [Pseudomonas soli]PYC43152.1 imidazole glycerol phosphate synthase subunit HisF [Pseudomonas soli]UXZ44319.1 AglZ/HisF2 family acetamidino modification protein [Pseudomonas soli]
MLSTRVIPVLLLSEGGLYKGKKFKNHRYVGDPLNAVKIFNEKEVDELVFLDISASQQGKGPDFELLADIASELFVPFAYGGAITSVAQAEKLFKLGVEKIILNSSAIADIHLVSEISSVSGSQSVVVAVDTKKSMFGKYQVYSQSGKVKSDLELTQYLLDLEKAGAGEVILSSIDREGTRSGYDLELIKKASSVLSIPLVAQGGAGSVGDFLPAIQAGASAVAAGTMFVFHGPHDAVLITYPEYTRLKQIFSQ